MSVTGIPPVLLITIVGPRFPATRERCRAELDVMEDVEIRH